MKSEHARFRATVGALPGAAAFMAAVGWALETEGDGVQVQLWVLRGEDAALRMAAAVAVLDAARVEAPEAEAA